MFNLNNNNKKKKIAAKFREDMKEIANKLEDECKGRPASVRITATSRRWKSECEHNYAKSTFITWRNKAYKGAPICCEWGIISFNPQEATTEITSEGTIDLLHFGLFTKTTTTLVKEALEAVMDNLCQTRTWPRRKEMNMPHDHGGCGRILLLQPSKGVLLYRMLLWRRSFRLQQIKVVLKRKP